jgi:hypothetical protein
VKTTDRLTIPLVAALAGGILATIACGDSAGSAGSGGSAGSAGDAAVAGNAGTGGDGGVQAGGAGGVSGSAGAPCSEPDESGLVVCGELDCECLTGIAWWSCWLPGDVPMMAGFPPSGGCPPHGQVGGSGSSTCGGEYITYPNGPVMNGAYCCYDSLAVCTGE